MIVKPRLLFSVFLLAVVLSLSQVHAQSVVSQASPSILFTQEEVAAAVDSEFVTELSIDTAGNPVGGVGAKINFDPSLLQVQKIDTLPVFPDYPAASFDNEKGLVTISGIVRSKEELYTGAAPFAQITWRTKAGGNTSIQLQYQPDSTKDSNIAVLYGNGDILEKVNAVSVSIDGTAAIAENTQNNSLNGTRLVPVTEAEEDPQSFLQTVFKYFPAIMSVAFLLSVVFQAFLFWEIQQLEKKLSSLPQ